EGMIALSGQPVFFNPFIMTELAREGLWDETPVLDLLKQRQIPILFLSQPPNPDAASDRGSGAGWQRLTPAMQQAVLDQYQLVTTVPVRREWYVYAPRE
ncbi:MAG: hypothetical protein ABI743_14890, partial [bacterium]